MEINRNAPATAQGELQIAADPQTVFAVLSAIDQWPSWNPDIKSVTLQGPVQPGTGFRWKSGPSTLTSTLQVVDPPRDRLDGHHHGHQGRARVPLPGQRWWNAGALRGVLGGPDRQAAQGLQPQDPGQGHPQHPVTPQDRGRAASRRRMSGLRGST